ncbi:MAG: hypothetical protein M1825_003902 [Sarcosagium campestre]|nr:MAG: hypothetical protein M1825_003902 [Sarcosagium campestre]
MALWTRDPPLDEVQWRSPAIARDMGGIHTNTVLPYFAQSPFFDLTSNNASLTTQATYNPSMFHLIQTREAFEGRLKTMQGLEFMVAHEPAGLNAAEPEASNNVWVIRKQIRRKLPGSEKDDAITVLSTYFVLGENIYMAPSVGSVIASRMLSTVTLLTQFLSTASPLPTFSPALGNTYFKPTPKPTSSLPLSSQQQQQQHRQSKESTPLPDQIGRNAGGSGIDGSGGGSVDGARMTVSNANGTGVDTIQEALSLAEALSLTLRHGDEYMDETPLVGEPGNFILSTKHANAPAVPPFERGTAAPSSQEAKLPRGSSANVVVGTRKVEKGATGLSKKTGSGGKSPIKSPTISTSTIDTAAGAAPKPKRRKSKAAGAISSA